MKKIYVITENSNPNSRAFNYPLIASKKNFLEKGYNIKLKFMSRFSQSFPNIPEECSLFFINKKIFRDYENSKNDIFEYLRKSAKFADKICWFDTSDSTYANQLEVLEYVDVYFKNQIYRDLDYYIKPFKKGRIFSDYFDTIYDAEEEDFDTFIPEKKDISKIKVSWNSSLEYYNPARYSLCAKFKRLLRPLTANFSDKVSISPFYNVNQKRENNLSCRLGLFHARKSILAHRKAVINKIEKRGLKCGTVSLQEYFEELKHSKIGVGPFGLGEITLRDFEIIICGAALLKPDMSHMKTWPDIFINGETCLMHKWDLSDFDEKIDFLLANPEKRTQIAENAQQKYKYYFTEDGKNEFVDRLLKNIADK